MRTFECEQRKSWWCINIIKSMIMIFIIAIIVILLSFHHHIIIIRIIIIIVIIKYYLYVTIETIVMIINSKNSDWLLVSSSTPIFLFLISWPIPFILTVYTWTIWLFQESTFIDNGHWKLKNIEISKLYEKRTFFGVSVSEYL